MKKIISVSLVMLMMGFLCLRGHTQSSQVKGAILVSVAPFVYSGPGDIISGATAWYGIRAYSKATAGNKAIQVCNVSDVACADLSTNVNGDLVISLIGGSDCSSVTCTVKTMYDQSGATNCGGVACDLTKATIGNRPTFVVSCVNGRPCLACARASSQDMRNTTGFTLSQPFSSSAVVDRTGSTSSFQYVINMGSNGPGIAFNSSINQDAVYAQTVLSATAADNAWHRIQALFNGASSKNVVDNSTTSGNAGVQNASGQVQICSNTANFMDGNVAEAGTWSGDKSSSFAALDANQKAYYNQ